VTNQLHYSDTLVIEVCWCGTHHAVPKTLRDYMLAQHRNGKSQIGIYCPRGHIWTFAGKGEADIERDLRERAETQNQHLRDQLEASERSKAALRGQMTKMKNRVGKGVCPCCNRTFTDLQRHMKSKHPDFASVDR
jgi:hypothetical protein